MKDTLKSHTDRKRMVNLESDMLATGIYDAGEGDRLKAMAALEILCVATPYT